VLDRSRRVSLGCGLALLALFALVWLGTAVTGPVPGVDTIGEDAAAYAGGHPRLQDALRFVELLFGRYGLFLMALVLALALVRRHRRAAIFTVVAVLVTWGARLAVLHLIDRPRPEWQLTMGLHHSPGFPSGHAANTTALATVVAIVATMLVRRRGLRRLIYALLAVVVVVVCLDRVLLGRHYPSDTVAGILFGAAVVLLCQAAFSPLPRSHAIRAEPLLESRPRGHRLAVVLNPIKVESVRQFRDVVTEMALEAGWEEPTWHYTTVEDPGTGMARAVQDEGADLVLVCGGDGTVREVCAALAGTGIAVGIIPAGTGNLLARNLSVPLYLRAAIDVALTGQDRAIDLVEVRGDGLDDTHFMVMAGMGFDAAIMGGVNEDIKKRIGWLAYVISALKSLMFPAVRLEISLDGGEFTKHRARTVVVGNVGYLQAGMPLLPDAAIDDGQLDVVLLHPRTFFSWIPLAVRILSKRRGIDDTVNRMTCRSIVIRASQDTPRQLDGDAIDPGRELRMACIHGRLLVRVPR